LTTTFISIIIKLWNEKSRAREQPLIQAPITKTPELQYQHPAESYLNNKDSVEYELSNQHTSNLVRNRRSSRRKIWELKKQPLAVVSAVTAISSDTFLFPSFAKATSFLNRSRYASGDNNGTVCNIRQTNIVTRLEAKDRLLNCTEWLPNRSNKQVWQVTDEWFIHKTSGNIIIRRIFLHARCNRFWSPSWYLLSLLISNQLGKAMACH